MEHSSIQVSKAMRQRLAAYKLPGMSYEDVLEVFTAAIPAATFRERYPPSRSEAIRAVFATAPGRQHDDAHRRRSARVASMDPVERMEDAFRLFELTRGKA